MHSPLTRRAAAASAILLLGATLGLAACSAPSTPGATTSATPSEAGASAQQLPPIMADLTTVDGTTVTVPLDNVIVLTGDKTDYKSWAATIEDPTIVSFTPGKDDGSAQFNPGLSPISTGTTKVSLDNSISGKHVTFTVTVTEKK